MGDYTAPGRGEQKDDIIAPKKKEVKLQKARVVKGAQDAIFIPPNRDVFSSKAIPGVEPKNIKGEDSSPKEAEKFMRDNLSKRIFKNQETVVVLGNDDADVKWIMEKLVPQNQEEEKCITVYNPQKEDEIEESERKLKEFLKSGQGCLVTRGELFNGMESASVVFVFDDPHASHFRANFLRASVEIITVDRNEAGVVETSMRNVIWVEEIWTAIREKNTEKVAELLEESFHPNIATMSSGHSLLHEAAQKSGNINIVKQLLKKDADIDAR